MMGLFYPILLLSTVVLYVFSIGAGTAQQYRVADLIYLVAPISALLLGIYAVGVFGGGSKRGLAILWLALGILCYAAGEAVWYYLTYVLDVAPSPSVGDVLFLLVYPCFLVGMSIEYRLSKMQLSASLLRQPFVLFLGLAALLVGYFGVYGALRMDGTTLETVIAAAYAVGDLVLLIATGMLVFLLSAYDGGNIQAPWRFVGFGFLAMLAGDLGLAFAGDAYDGLVIVRIAVDLSWILGYFLLGWGMVQFARISLQVRAELEQKLAAITAAKSC